MYERTNKVKNIWKNVSPPSVLLTHTDTHINVIKKKRKKLEKKDTI